MYQSTKTLTKFYAGGAAGLAAGSFVTILVFMLQRFAGVDDMPPDVVAAMTSLCTLLFTLLAMWITPILPGEIKPVDSGVVDMAQPSRISQDALTDQQRREIGRMLADHATGITPAKIHAAKQSLRSVRVEPTAQAADASHVASTSQER